MKRFWGVMLGILTGFGLFMGSVGLPVSASTNSLTINIPNSQNVQVTDHKIKLNSAVDGSFTFTGKTDSDDEVTIIKRGGNNKEYTTTADENGNFSKVVKMAVSTRKCKFIVKSGNGDRLIFVITNSAYKKAVPVNESQVGYQGTVAKAADSSSDATADSSSDKENDDDSKIDTDQAGKVVGNARSGIYHTADQQDYHMDSANAVYFNSEADAQAAGFRKSLR